MAVSSRTQQDMQRAKRPKRKPQQQAQMLPTGYTAGTPKPRTSKPLAPTPKPFQGDERELLGTPKPVIKPTGQELYGSEGMTPKRIDDGQLGQTPAPTVATTDTPVITRTPGQVEPEVMGAPDYSPIQDLDQEGLQDYIDMMSLRTSRGQQITEQEQLNLMKANRMLQAQQMQTQDPYEQAIASAEELRASELERIKAQADEYYQGRQGEIESMAQRRIEEAKQAGEKTQQAVAQQLSFSGFGRSTYAGEKQAEVQQAVNRNIETAQQRRDAELARAQAERDGAPADVIARYDAYIDGLRTDSTKYNNELIQQMNEYNAQNTASYQDKINNILQLAQTMGSDAPLTEEETALAKSYATLAIDSKGDLNNAFLQSVPPTLLPAVIAEASMLKGAIEPEQEAPETITGPDGAIYARTGNGFEQVVGGEQPEEEVKTYKSVIVDGKPFAFDETTGTFKEGPTEGKNTHPRTNVEPTGNLVTHAGTGRVLDASAMPAFEQAYNELQEAGLADNMVFAEGFRDQAETIRKMGERVGMPGATAEELRAAGHQIAGVGGSLHEQGLAIDIYGDQNLNAPTPEQVAILNKYGFEQKAGAGDMGDFTYVGTGAGDSGAPDPKKFSQYRDFIEDGKTPTGMKYGSSDYNQFVEEATQGYIQGSEPVANSAGLTISNPTAFTNADPQVRKQVNQGLTSIPAFENTMDKLIELVEEYGTERLPSAAKTKMQTLYKDAMLQAKEIYNLGVLNGPDLDIMEGVIPDPTAPGAKWKQLRGTSYKDALNDAKSSVMGVGYSNAKLLGMEAIPEDGETGDASSIVSSYLD